MNVRARLGTLVTAFVLAAALVPAALAGSPRDGRSPDTIDAALQAPGPAVTVVRSSGFSWSDFGIGFAVAVGSLLLLAGLGAAVMAARQLEKTSTTPRVRP